MLPVVDVALPCKQTYNILVFTILIQFNGLDYVYMTVH